MDDGNDYNVQTKLRFHLDFDGEGEFNLLMLPTVQQEFVKHVKRVFEADDTLRDYISGNLDFRFDGRWINLAYTFSCHDENEEEAESFSAYCVRHVQKRLEEFGCRLTQTKCTAEEADMTWLDELEDAVFGPRNQPAESQEEQPTWGGMEMMQ